MSKIVLTLAIVLMFQTTNAQNVLNQGSRDHIQKSKAALNQLLKDKILVLDPNDNTFKIDVTNDSTKSILEQLEKDGLLNEEVSAHGPWCY